MSDDNEDALAGLGADPKSEARGAAAWDPALVEPVRKGGFPRWVWYGCGCGCLVLFLAAIALAISTWVVVKDAADPEVQWPALGELLPFDERPSDLELKVGLQLLGFYSEFRLEDVEDGYHAIVRDVADSARLAALMDPDSTSPGAAVVGGERFQLELQGETVQAMRFENVDEDVPFLGAEKQAELDLGPGLRVRIPRAERTVVVELRSGPEGEAITDEQVADFFDHFDLWR